MRWRPYLRVFTTAARESSANLRQLAANMAISLFRIGLLAAIYAVAYRFGKASLHYENIVWSLAVYFAFILNLGLRDLFSVVDRDIQTGAVEVQLIKPMDWRLMKACQVLGKNSVEFVLQIIVSSLFLLLIVGVPHVPYWSPGFLAGFLLLAVLAIMSASCIYITIGLSAF